MVDLNVYKVILKITSGTYLPASVLLTWKAFQVTAESQERYLALDMPLRGQPLGLQSAVHWWRKGRALL